MSGRIYLNGFVVLFFEEARELLAQAADGLGVQLRHTTFSDTKNLADLF